LAAIARPVGVAGAKRAADQIDRFGKLLLELLRRLFFM
jgi:hypothetical protein